MGSNFAPAQTSFNAGKLSPYWAGRIDMAKYGNGCYELVNFVPIPQGPAKRRMGTRFVAPTKNQAHRSWLGRFVFSEDDSYILEFGDNYIRFYTDNGQLRLSSTPAAWSNATAYVPGDLVSLAGVNYYCKVGHTNQSPPNATYWHTLTGDIYEIYSPFTIADLTNTTDGTFRVSMEQSGDVIYMAHPRINPRKLTRFGVNRWVLERANLTGGPFEDVDPDQTTTVYASATTGNVTLTASTAIFTTEMIDQLFLIEQPLADEYKVWEVGKTIALNDERRSDSNVYQALNAATTGTVKPTHREGAKFDGDAGVQWQYLHSGYGIVRINSVAGTTATGTVVSTLPSEVVGSGNTTTKWAKYAWATSTGGFPSLVRIFRERLVFARGQQLWGSVTGDFENFSARDGAETLPDSAFTITIGSSETNACVWMSSRDALLLGTRGAEFSISEVTSSEVFGPGNIKATQESSYGSRQVDPAIIGDSVLFVQRSGRRVRDMRFSFNTNGYEANDLMVLSDQIANGQIIQMEYAAEPSSTMWACCQNGDLIALAHQLEQDVIGWHPHRIGGGSGEQGMVESVRVIPSPDGTHDQIWMQVFRVINGAPTRYIEYMERDWYADQQPIEDALLSDAGATFDGFIPGETAILSGGVNWVPGESIQATLSFTPVAGDIGDYLVLVGSDQSMTKVRVDTAANPATVTIISTVPPSLRDTLCTNVSWARDVISGLDYLEGEEVTITVNGAAHPRRTVTGGQITLQAPASIVQVGLPADSILETMRVEGGAANGTSQGKIKRIHQVTLRVHESLGGKLGPAGSEDTLQYRTPNDPMDNPPPVHTGDFTMPYPDGYNKDGRIRVVCDQALPFTLVAIFPQMKVEDRM